MRLLWFNLATDLDDPVLGFTGSWIGAVAERVTSIDVVTMRAGRMELPANVRVHSVGKEEGLGIPRRVLRFYSHVRRILRSTPIDACFSHMMPIFTVLSAPALRPRGIPIITWYAHPSVTPVLRMAHHVSDRMVTSLPSAYRYRRDKLVVIGQGIDTARFRPGPTPLDEPPMILCAGRLSPVKDHPTLIRAVALLRDRIEAPFQAVLLGNPARPSDDGYVVSLKDLIQELALENIVHLRPAVPAIDLPDWYRRSTVHVNLTPAGFGDKVVLEAMACGRPSLVCNEDFRPTLDRCADRLTFPPGNERELCERLCSLLTESRESRIETGSFLRAQVERFHSLPALADRIVALSQELHRLGAGPGHGRKGFTAG